VVSTGAGVRGEVVESSGLEVRTYETDGPRSLAPVGSPIGSPAVPIPIPARDVVVLYAFDSRAIQLGRTANLKGARDSEGSEQKGNCSDRGAGDFVDA